MSPLSTLLFRRRSKSASKPAARVKRRRADTVLGRAELLEPRAMLAVTSVVDQLGVAGWAGAFVGVGDVPGSASVNAVASDSSGNRYVGGSFQGKVDFDPGTALVSKTADTTTGFVAKFDSAGQFLSVITLDVAVPVGDDPAGSSSVAALAISGSGKVAIAGDYTGTVDLNPSIAAVSNATGNGAFAIVLGTDWSWQNSLITFNDVGAGPAEAGVTNMAFVDNSPSSTNTNLYLGGWAVGFSIVAGPTNDAFILKTKFSDADGTDWVKTLGGTSAFPAGLAATSTGVVMTATYSGSLTTITAIAPSLNLPAEGGIAISLKADGTYGTGNWLRTFSEQKPGEVFGFTAAMPLTVSPLGDIVYLATTTDDGNATSSTIYAIKNTGTSVGADLWFKTTSALFGDKAPLRVSAQTLGLDKMNLYVGGTALTTDPTPWQIGLTALDPATGNLKGTAVVASGSVEGLAGIVTADGKLLVGGTFTGSASFPTLAQNQFLTDGTMLFADAPEVQTGFVAALANPFVITPQFDAYSRPIAGLDTVQLSFSGAISSTATIANPWMPSSPLSVIPIGAFTLKRGTTVVPLAGAVAYVNGLTDIFGGPAIARSVSLDNIAALTATPGIYTLSFDLSRLSAADRAKVGTAVAGATIGTATATYTVVDPVTRVSGSKGFAEVLTSTGWSGDSYNGTQAISVNDVVTDANGVVYVAGTFNDVADFDPSSAVVSRTSTTKSVTTETGTVSVPTQDGFVAVYNADGTFNKVITFPGTGDLSIERIALDGAGKLIMAGTSTGVNTGFTTSTTRNGFVCSLNIADGKVSNLQTLTTTTAATTPWGSPLGVSITDLERDASGTVYLLGSFPGNVTIGTTTLSTASSGGGSDVGPPPVPSDFIAAFAPSTSVTGGLKTLTASVVDGGIAGLSSIQSLDLAITSDGVPVIGAVGPSLADQSMVAAIAGINTSTAQADWVESMPLQGFTTSNSIFFSLTADNAGRVFAGVASRTFPDFLPAVVPQIPVGNYTTVGPSGLVAVKVTKTVSPGEGDKLSTSKTLWTQTSFDIGVDGYDALPYSVSADNAGAVYVSGYAHPAGGPVNFLDNGVDTTAAGSFLLKLSAADGTYTKATDLLYQPDRAPYGSFQPASGKFVNFGPHGGDGFPGYDFSVNGPSKPAVGFVVPPFREADFVAVLSGPFAPGVITTTGSLTARMTTYGTPSSAASFTVKAEDLSAVVTVTAPSGFEVSRDNATFGPTTTFVPSGGAVNGTVWVRLAANTPAGSRSGSVTLSSPRASTVAVSIPASTVSAKALTITGISIANKEYNGTTAATITGTAAYSGLVNGETFSVGGSGSAVFSDKNVGTGKAVTVSGYAAPSGNYAVTQPVGLKANITAKALTITGISIANKEYNGNTAATITGTPQYVGLVSGETFSSVTGTRSAVFFDKNVGTGKTVTVSGFTAPSSNYTVTQPTGLTANITAKNLTVSGARATSKTYDGTTTAVITGATLTGVVTGDVVTLTGGGTFAQAGVGNSIGVTSSFVLGGAGAGNYTLTQPTGLTANITPKGLTITGIGIANKEYNGTTAATITGTAAYSGLVNGETFSVGGSGSAVFSDKNVGTGKAVTVSGYKAPSGNYTVTQPVGLKANITAKALTISGISIANKEYNGNTTATITGTPQYVGLVNGETFSSVTGTRSAVFSDKNVGTNKAVTVSGFTAPSSNYTVTQPTGLTANITAKNLTITGISIANKVYDGTTAATITGTAAYSGLVAGESFTVTGIRSAVFSDANVGTGKTVIVSGFTAPSSGNYTVTQPTGLKANITAKALTITGIAIANKTWDGTTAATITGTAAYAGLVNGETFSVAGSPVAVFFDKNVATGKTVTVSGFTAPSSNYTLTQPVSLKANIDPWATMVFSKQDKKVTITFDRDVTGVDTGDFQISGSTSAGSLPATRITDGQQYVGTVTLSGSGKIYTLQLEKLPAITGSFTLVLVAQNSGIKDSNQLLMQGDARVGGTLP